MRPSVIFLVFIFLFALVLLGCYWADTSQVRLTFLRRHFPFTMSETEGAAAKEMDELTEKLKALGAVRLKELLDRVVQNSSADEDENADGSGEQSAGATAGPSSFVRPFAPKLPMFSGLDPAKGEVRYDQWRYHLQCLVLEGGADPSIMQAVRQSVRGQAADVMQYLGPKCPPEFIIQKFDSVFGDALSDQQLFQRFYSSKQEGHESVVDWGCRLQRLASKLPDASGLDSEAIVLMLRNQFFSGMRDGKIKEAIRHLYDDGKDFDEQFKAARKVESEAVRVSQSEKSKGAALAQQESNSTSQQDRIEKALSGINDTLRTLDRRVKRLERKEDGGTSTVRPTCGRCQRSNHTTSQCVAKRDKYGRHLNGSTPSPMSGGR